MGALERLKLARELAGTIGTLKSETDVLRRVALAKKVSSLRAILRGEKRNSIDNLDLHAGASTVRVLRDYWDSLKDAPELERARAKQYLQIITRYLASMGSLSKNQDGTHGASGISRLEVALGEVGDGDYGEKVAERQRAQFDEFMSRAPDVESMANSVELAKAQGTLKVIEEAERSVRDQIRAKLQELEESLKEERRLAYGTTPGMSDVDWQARYNAYIEKRRAAAEAIEAEFQPMQDSMKEQRRQAEMVRNAVGADLKRNVLNASPVTHEQATDWALAQKIESSGMSALKKIGYDPAQCRADMAEFYRLTGGRLSKVRIKASRGRASAENIHGHKNRTINMGAGFCKRTLFHELGHHLEADPAVYAAALAFLVKRRESDTVYRLSELTGLKGYKRDEVAYKDTWFNPYVGKVYSYDVTEVFSMGVESWCDDSTLTTRVQNDPEHMKLIAGFMKSPQHPLMGAVKQVLAQAAETDDEAADAAVDSLESGLKALAAGVEFVKREPPPESERGIYYSEADQAPSPPYWLKGAVYLGAHKELHLWQHPKVRDPATKRQKKGFVLVSYGNTGYVMQWMAAFSMDEAKAIARVWATEGRPRYLTNYKTVQQLAQTLGAA